MLILIGFSLYAENLRGEVVGSITAGTASVGFNPEQLVVVESDSITDFQDGLEIQIQLPEGLRRYQNSFALMIFKSVDPGPSTENQAYQGSRAFMRLLPARDSIFIRIPFAAGHGITGDALTDVLPVPVKIEDFPLVVTVLPVMKGVPDRAFDEVLTISVEQLLKNEGTLTVNLSNPTGDLEEELTVTIDGQPVDVGEVVQLAAGIHNVRVDSSLAPTVEKNIAIEPGQESILDIELDYRAPEVVITVPTGAVVLLDGETIPGGSSPHAMEVEPGDHTVTYKLGDMEVSRIFNIRPGGKVNVDLAIDISIIDTGETGGNPYGAGDG